MKGKVSIAVAIAACLAQLLFVPLAQAHSEAAPAGPVAASVLEPRVEAASADVELLGIVEGLQLIVYLDHYATNGPIDGARLSVERNGESFEARSIGDGAYRFDLPWLASPGSHALLFTLVGSDLSDLLTATLEIPGGGGAAGAANGAPNLHTLSWSGLSERQRIAAAL
ncbi:MAG: hypothetical protein WCS09_11680, partial [Pseudomonadota bacterium]